MPNLEAVRSEPDRRRRLDLLTRYLASSRAPGEREELTLGDDLALGSLDVVELLGRLEGGGASSRAPAVGPATTIRELREALAAGGAAQKSALPVGAPWWWRGPHLRPWRAVVRGAAIAWWSALGYEVAAEWHCDPARVPRPFVLAVAPHLAWLDAFVVYRALPPRLRRRFLVVTNRDLRPLFAPAPGTPRRERLYLAGAYYAVLPSLFPFTLLTPYGPTREALLATAGYLARGYGVLTFPKGLLADPAHHDRGPALLACETGAPLLPAVLLGNDGLSWRRARPPHRIRVRFGAPLWPGAAETPDALAARTEAALAALKEGD